MGMSSPSSFPNLWHRHRLIQVNQTLIFPYDPALALGKLMAIEGLVAGPVVRGENILLLFTLQDTPRQRAVHVVVNYSAIELPEHLEHG